MLWSWRGLALLVMASQGLAHDDDGRRGRAFWFGNGMAMVNTTTVAVTTSFFTVVALGVMSVLHDAQLKAEKAARDATSTTTAVPLVLTDKVDRELAQYRREMEEYEIEYQRYLEDYARWARLHGQDPSPPGSRQRR